MGTSVLTGTAPAEARATIPLAAWIAAASVSILLAFVIILSWKNSGSEVGPISSRATHHHMDSAALNIRQKLLASGTMVAPANSINPYEIHLWNTDTGESVRTWRSQNALDLELSADGKVLASRGSDGALLWRVEDGSLIRTLAMNGEALQLAFSPDDQLLAAAGTFRLFVWNLHSSSVTRTLNIDSCESHSLAFSSSGHMLAVGCGQYNKGEEQDDNYYSILLWDVRSGTLIRQLHGHKSDVTVLSFSPDEKVLASGGGDGALRLWQISDGTLLHERFVRMSRAQRMLGYRYGVYALAISPNGELVAFSGSDGRIYLVRTRDGSDSNELRGGEGSVLRLAFEDDGKKLMSVSKNGAIQLWSVGPAASSR
jgi:WD40 repeat protein